MTTPRLQRTAGVYRDNGIYFSCLWKFRYLVPVKSRNNIHQNTFLPLIDLNRKPVEKDEDDLLEEKKSSEEVCYFNLECRAETQLQGPVLSRNTWLAIMLLPIDIHSGPFRLYVRSGQRERPWILAVLLFQGENARQDGLDVEITLALYRISSHPYAASGWGNSGFPHRVQPFKFELGYRCEQLVSITCLVCNPIVCEHEAGRG